MIDAVYAANEYIKAVLDVMDLECGEMYPGTFAPSIENGTKFVTYSVVPTDTYDLAGLKVAYVTYRFYNPDFDESHRINKIVRDAFNVYNIQDAPLVEDGILFKETFFRTMSSAEAAFAEGVDYYLLTCELKLQYVEY